MKHVDLMRKLFPDICNGTEGFLKKVTWKFECEINNYLMVSSPVNRLMSRTLDFIYKAECKSISSKV